MNDRQQQAQEQITQQVEHPVGWVSGATEEQFRLYRIAIALKQAATSQGMSQDTGRFMHGYTQQHADYARELAALIEHQIETEETA